MVGFWVNCSIYNSDSVACGWYGCSHQDAVCSLLPMAGCERVSVAVMTD